MEQLAIEASRQNLAGDNLYFSSAGIQNAAQWITRTGIFPFLTETTQIHSMKNVAPDYLNAQRN